MTAARTIFSLCFFALNLLFFYCIPSKGFCIYLYKQYIVRQYGNQEILCEPYIVQQDDYVLKLFRQKGEISHKDFPEFLEIFKRINSHISDVNTILAGQHIFIPLTKLKPDSLPGQSTGIVKIPFVTISSLPELLKNHSSTHEVKKGEVVSGIIATKSRGLGTKEYKEALKIFKLINPQITNINCIYPGQKLHVPDSSLQNQPWYTSLFDQHGNIVVQPSFEDTNVADSTIVEPEWTGNEDQTPESPFQKVAVTLGAKLLNKGIYYFPREGNAADFKIDLSRSPLMEFSNGGKVLFHENGHLSPAAQKQLSALWKNLKIVSVSPNASSDDILNALCNEQKANNQTNMLAFVDRSVRVEVRSSWISGKSSGAGASMQRIGLALIDQPAQKTPESIRQYLEQKHIIIKDIFKSAAAEAQQSAHQSLNAVNHNALKKPLLIAATMNREAFVRDLSEALGFRYAPNISITFPYYGIQIEAVSNLISNGDGKELLVDFGELYGDALFAVKNTGFNIIALHPGDKISAIIRKLLNAFSMPYIENPTFWAARRPLDNNISLTLTGFKIDDNKGNTIVIAKAPVNGKIIQFLTEQNMKIIMIELSE